MSVVAVIDLKCEHAVCEGGFKKAMQRSSPGPYLRVLVALKFCNIFVTK